jgi:hypothetical protein
MLIMVLTHIAAFITGAGTGITLIAILAAGRKDDRP